MSLQRKLDEYDIDFSHLLNGIRYRLALVYLKDSRISLSEISNKLGYKESSSLSRAFKRWASISPKEYRNALIENT